MRYEIEVSVDDDDILVEDTKRFNAMSKQSNPSWIDWTSKDYLQFLVSNWFTNRHDEIVQSRAKELTERYKVDSEFRAKVREFLNGDTPN